MECPKCGSTNVIVGSSATEKKAARHGILYWIFIGWWWHALLWIAATIPMLFWRLIHKNRNTKTMVTTSAVCQDCGNSWTISQKKA